MDKHERTGAVGLRPVKHNMRRHLTEQDRKDIRRMRELFWMKVNGEITHEKLEIELKKINDRQLFFDAVAKGGDAIERVQTT